MATLCIFILLAKKHTTQMAQTTVEVVKLDGNYTIQKDMLLQVEHYTRKIFALAKNSEMKKHPLLIA